MPQPTYVPVGTPPHDIMCSICRDPWDDPVELRPCGHVFCKNCIGTMLPKCPDCRQAIQARNVPNRVLLNIAQNVKVRCELCNWVGSREESKTHKNRCPLALDEMPAPPTTAEQKPKEKKKRGLFGYLFGGRDDDEPEPPSPEVFHAPPPVAAPAASTYQQHTIPPAPNVAAHAPSSGSRPSSAQPQQSSSYQSSPLQHHMQGHSAQPSAYASPAASVATEPWMTEMFQVFPNVEPIVILDVCRNVAGDQSKAFDILSGMQSETQPMNQHDFPPDSRNRNTNQQPQQQQGRPSHAPPPSLFETISRPPSLPPQQQQTTAASKQPVPVAQQRPQQPPANATAAGQAKQAPQPQPQSQKSAPATQPAAVKTAQQPPSKAPAASGKLASPPDYFSQLADPIPAPAATSAPPPTRPPQQQPVTVANPAPPQQQQPVQPPLPPGAAPAPYGPSGFQALVHGSQPYLSEYEQRIRTNTDKTLRFGSSPSVQADPATIDKLLQKFAQPSFDEPLFVPAPPPPQPKNGKSKPAALEQSTVAAAAAAGQPRSNPSSATKRGSFGRKPSGGSFGGTARSEDDDVWATPLSRPNETSAPAANAAAPAPASFAFGGSNGNNGENFDDLLSKFAGDDNW
jgi:hypothetical protein